MFDPFSPDGSVNLLVLTPLIDGFVQWTKGYIESRIKPDNPAHDRVIQGYTVLLYMVTVVTLNLISPGIHDAKTAAIVVTGGIASALIGIGFYHALNPVPQSPNPSYVAKMQTRLDALQTPEPDKP